MLKGLVKEILLESSRLKSAIAADDELTKRISELCQIVIDCVKRSGTIYCCGNGGSCCDSMHLTEELIARYKGERPGIKAVHFGDPCTLTCWANDYSYETVFERQVETFCTKDDLLLLFSTSGKSANIIRAATAAKRLGVFSVGLTGKGGGQLKDLCDLPIVVPADLTERIQEVHITIVHIICEAIERTVFA